MRSPKYHLVGQRLAQRTTSFADCKSRQRFNQWAVIIATPTVESRTQSDSREDFPAPKPARRLNTDFLPASLFNRPDVVPPLKKSGRKVRW